MTSTRKIGFVDRIIEKLPEIHFRGYNYCGPNTDLERRIARGELATNKLDWACMEHDIAYAESNDLKTRCKADKILVLKATRRIYANDSRIGERIVALFISWLISIKFILSKTELYFGNIRKCFAMKSNKN